MTQGTVETNRRDAAGWGGIMIYRMETVYLAWGLANVEKRREH